MSTDTTRPEDSRLGLVTFLSAMALAGVATGWGLVAADRHQRVSREHLRQERALLQSRACLERGALFVARVARPLGSLDPLSALWDEAMSVTLPLQKQNIAMPVLGASTIDTVQLQGLTDGRVVAWRISWDDPTPDSNVDAGRFTDAVALQFPLVRNAAFTMGAHNQPVQILHWKALWQKDVDEQFQDVQDLHPNYWADLYWFADGRFPQRVPDDFSDPRSQAWFPAYVAGNPLADFHRRLPVEELSAEGYGSLTSHTASATFGGGTWRDGGWHVVLARPLRTGDPHDARFWLGATGSVGVAVWDGSAGNVGGRKHWTQWTEFEVSP